MKYLSLFSGIEAATAAWKPLGWKPVAFSEIEPFPCEVLKSRYPDVPNLGDVTQITESQIKKLGQIDLVVFGSPCQDLSVAGKRKGFNGERSSLFRDAIRIIQWARKHNGCRFALWENVPGAFSSNQGQDFNEVLRLLTGAEHTPPQKGWQTAGVAHGKTGLVEWRLLNAQYFGVPQRRRRIFALADFGDWADREPILFEREGLSGDIEKSKNPQKDIARCLRARASSSHREDSDNFIVETFPNETANCLQTTSNDYSRADGFNMVVHGSQDPIVSDKAHAIGRNNGQENVVCFAQNTRGELRLYNGDGNIAGAITTGGGTPGQGYPAIAFNPVQDGMGLTGIAPPIGASEGGGNQGAVCYGASVRRLTPVECERLQGFEDDFTKIAGRKKLPEDCPDGPRYKALGNSIAVPCLLWIGQRVNNEIIRIAECKI